MRSITPAFVYHQVPIFDLTSAAIEIREECKTCGWSVCGYSFFRGHILWSKRTIGIHTFGNHHLLELKKRLCRGFIDRGIDSSYQFPAGIVLVEWSGSEPTTLVVFLVRQVAFTRRFRGIAPTQTRVVSLGIELRLAWDWDFMALVPGYSGATAALREVDVLRFFLHKFDSVNQFSPA
jgi:hypothetical protein